MTRNMHANETVLAVQFLIRFLFVTDKLLRLRAVARASNTNCPVACSPTDVGALEGSIGAPALSEVVMRPPARANALAGIMMHVKIVFGEHQRSPIFGTLAMADFLSFGFRTDSPNDRYSALASLPKVEMSSKYKLWALRHMWANSHVWCLYPRVANTIMQSSAITRKTEMMNRKI